MVAPGGGAVSYERGTPVNTKPPYGLAGATREHVHAHATKMGASRESGFEKCFPSQIGE